MTLPETARNRLLLGLIVLLGLALRSYHFALSPLWRDETFTRYFAAQSLSYLWTTGFKMESNPPGYYTLIHGAMLLLGTTAAALRSLSVVASTLTILVVYVLGKTLVNPRIGLIGALVFALCPSEIFYAQEARTYAVLQVPVALMLLGLAQFLARPKAPGPLVIYAAGAIAAIYCHNTVLFAVAAFNLAVLSAVWGPKASIGREDLTRWLIVNVMAGVAGAPAILMAVHQAGSSNISWIEPLSFNTLFGCFSGLISGPMAESLHTHAWILLAALGVTLYGSRSLDRRVLTVLILVPAFFLLLIVLFSLRQSMIIPRVFLWFWIPLSVLLGLSVEMKRRLVPQSVLLGLTIAFFAFGLKTQYFSHRILTEDWRNLGLLGPGSESSSSLIVLGPRVTLGPLAYYHPEILPRVRLWHDDAVPPEFMGVFLGEAIHVPEISTEELHAAISSSHAVYLLTASAPRLNVPLPASLPAPNRREDVMMGTFGLHLSVWNNSDDLRSAAPR